MKLISVYNMVCPFTLADIHHSVCYMCYYYEGWDYKEELIKCSSDDR